MLLWPYACRTLAERPEAPGRTPPYNISPELMIEHLLAAGKVPGTRTCARCGSETDDLIQVVTECERSWSHETGGFSWLTLLLTTCFFPITIWFWEKRQETVYGEDKVYSLPLPVCMSCQPAMRNPKALKQGLHMVAAYARLLEKFPNAKVTVR